MEGIRQQEPMRPEQRLMLAVLEDAVRTYWETEAAPDRVQRREVDEWFASDATGWPFSFANVCRALGLDAVQIRAWVACTRRLLAA